jgi:hypothetical protein
MMRLMLNYLLRVVLAAAVVLPVAWLLMFRMLTGHWIPTWKVDSLAKPVAVRGWTTEGLQLTDGRLLPLPGVTALPKESVALSAGIKRGVEIDGEGRVYGLVNIRRTCGNDPVVQRIVRVDLADVLVFLNEATPTRPLSPQQMDWPQGVRRGFNERRWSVGDLGNFMQWQYEGHLRAENL